MQTLLGDALEGIGPVERATILGSVRDLRLEWERGIADGRCGTCGTNVNERSRQIFSNVIRIYTPCGCLNNAMLARSVERLQGMSEYAIATNRAQAGLSPMFATAALETFEHRPGTESMLEAAFAFDMAHGLFIMGSYGSGKSHVAAAICNRMLDQEYRCRYANVPETLAELRATYNGNGKEDAILDELTTTDLLVLDDIGAEKPTEWAVDRLYTVIDSRYRHMRPTIYTTNLSLDEMDLRIGGRIVDRVLGSCQVVVCDAKSYRQEVQQLRLRGNARGGERDRRCSGQ